MSTSAWNVRAIATDVLFLFAAIVIESTVFVSVRKGMSEEINNTSTIFDGELTREIFGGDPFFAVLLYTTRSSHGIGELNNPNYFNQNWKSDSTVSISDVTFGKRK